MPQAPFLLKKTRFWSWYVAAGAFFFVEKRVFGVGTLPQAPFFVEKRVFGVGTLPQAPFFGGKTRFWCWNVAAGAFFCKKIFF